MTKNNKVDDVEDYFEEEISKKSFETIYLRLSYAKNIGNVHIPKELFDIHAYTVNVKSYKAFLSNASMNLSMGFSKEDFRSVAMWYLAEYLSSMSILMQTKEREEFIKSYQKKNGEHTFPSDFDFVKKDQSNFISFLSQRTSDLNRVIVQAAKNVYGSRSMKRLYKMDINANPSLGEEHFRSLSDKELKSLGYHLLEHKQAKPIIKKVGLKYTFLDFFEVDGVSYRKIYRTPEIHSYLEDIPSWENMPFSDLIDQEEFVESQKTEKKKQRLLSKFYNGSDHTKKKMLERLKRFLIKKDMQKELAIVKKMLSKL